MDTVKYTLQMTESRIDILIKRKKINNFYIKIYPDCSVSVSMPLFMNINRIYDFIDTKSKWIEKNIKKFQTAKKSDYKEKISNGGTVTILDSRYMVFIYSGKENKVIKDGFSIYIYSKKYQDLKYVKKQYDEYLKETSREYFEKVIDKYYPIFASYNISRPLLKVKKMKSKWGSCIPKDKIITLNSCLFKTSSDCIEYVVFHELAHLIYHGHKRNFYNFLLKHMPDYRITEKKLDSEAVKLISS
ncbi:MAG: SprT family zinc-dependent metalloprotease [Endomicrobiaceae bacterium]